MDTVPRTVITNAKKREARQSSVLLRRTGLFSISGLALSSESLTFRLKALFDRSLLHLLLVLQRQSLDSQFFQPCFSLRILHLRPLSPRFQTLIFNHSFSSNNTIHATDTNAECRLFPTKAVSAVVISIMYTSNSTLRYFLPTGCLVPSESPGSRLHLHNYFFLFDNYDSKISSWRPMTTPHLSCGSHWRPHNFPTIVNTTSQLSSGHFRLEHFLCQ